MHDFEDTILKTVSLHRIGNKPEAEGVKLSQKTLSLTNDVTHLLLSYFLTPVKKEVYFNFYDERSLERNFVYNAVSQIFDNPNCLHEQSIALAEYLYEQGEHPKVKNGDFFVAYFEKCLFDDEEVSAVGLFKAESRDYFLKIYTNGDDCEMLGDSGINIGKLEKACLVFNTQKEDGYVACVHDATKNSEGGYWLDLFLQVCERADDFYFTQNIMTACKEYIVKQLPEEFEVTKIDQADLLNRSAQFFQENDSFDIDHFTETILPDPATTRSFKSFKQGFERERDINISNQFDLSEAAVKKQSKIFKSVIKLDKNFHIYVHGNRDLIERAYDEEAKMHYYKLMYKYEE